LYRKAHCMKRTELAEHLRGGLFISSMMGRTDGVFVAEHGDGAAMVQIGALVADLEDRSHDERFLLPEQQEDMVPVLKREVDAARAALGATPIGLNAAPGDLESAVRMAGAFREAGGDIFELNVHGSYGKLLRRGLLKDMVLPQNRSAMIEWLEGLCALDIAVVAKFLSSMTEVDFVEVLEAVGEIEGLFGVHFNVRCGDGPNLAFVERVAPHVNGVLFCSGHVRTRADVDALLAAGADCVGLAQGVLDEPGIIARLRRGAG